MNNSTVIRSAVVAGPVVAIILAATTSSVRDQVGASNVGIALAIVVVLAALVSRGAGLATAAAAALGFNFFHTQPYHSLRIHSARDVVIVALLAGLGVGVSDINSWRRRRDLIAFRHVAATDAPVALEQLLSDNHPVGEIWPVVATSIMDQLSLADCRFDRSPADDLVLISRVAGRTADGDDGFTLPGTGAQMPVTAKGEHLGFLVVTPRNGISSLWVERRVVVALADHIAIALTYTGHRAAETSSQATL